MALIVTLVNKSQLADVSNYAYQVLVGDGSVDNSKVLAAGTIKKHYRVDGWAALVQRVLDKERVEHP